MIALAAQATRRALIIGIGAYPNENGWNKINGDKDIPMVKQILRDNNFAEKDIVVLRNEQATYTTICKELNNLISLSQRGDYIYIHFSGHGQQVTDTNGDEEDGYDEAWIPYDSKYQYLEGEYEGENHLTDDQLNHYLHEMRERIGDKGKIIVIADACHSGGSSREPQDSCKYIIRGASDKFIIPHASSNDKTPQYEIEWTIISACKSYQCNYEYQGSGSLTYALFQIRKDFSALSARQIRQKVSICISNIIKYTQTPVLETMSGKEMDKFL